MDSLESPAHWKFLSQRLLALFAASLVLAFALYWPSLGLGFDFDDYHQVRHYPLRELLQCFHDRWDPYGLEQPYYRPLAVGFYALRFTVFGYDARANHVAGVVLLAVIATMLGAFVLVATGRPAFALLAATLLTVHPAMVDSAAVWISIQFQEAELLFVMPALLWWLVCRDRPAVWWLPLFFLQTCAFMVKEDGIMLLPSVLLMHAIRGEIFEKKPLSLPPRPVVLASLAWLLLLVGCRQLSVGGYQGLTVGSESPRLLAAGPMRVFTLDYGSGFARVAAGSSGLLLAGIGIGVALSASAEPAGTFSVACGVMLLAMFNMPFLISSKISQYHILAVGHTLALVGSVLLLSRRPGILPRLVAWALCVVMMAAMWLTSRQRMAAYDLMTPFMQWRDAQATSWKEHVPPELWKQLQERHRMRESRKPPQAAGPGPRPAP